VSVKRKCASPFDLKVCYKIFHNFAHVAGLHKIPSNSCLMFWRLIARGVITISATLSRLRHPLFLGTIASIFWDFYTSLPRFQNLYSLDSYHWRWCLVIGSQTLCLSANPIKLFCGRNLRIFRNKLECLSLGKPFKPSLMFAGKTGAYPRVEPLKARVFVPGKPFPA